MPERFLVDQTALDAKVSKGSQIINAGDYGIQGTSDGSVDSTSAFISALNDLRPGYRLIVPPPPNGQHYKITGALTVPVSGVDIDGGGRGCEIRQYTRSPYRPVFDCLNVDNVSIHGFTLTLNGGFIGAPGTSFRAENGYTYVAGVWSNGGYNTFYDMTINYFVCGVMLSSWDGSVMSTTMRKNNTVRDIDLYSVNFGVLWNCQDGLKISGLRSRDIPDPTSQGGGPPHTFYGTGSATMRSRDVQVSDCITVNSPIGCAYQIKYTDGISMSNMLADNCNGIFNGIDISDAEFSDLVSRNDFAGIGASFSIQKVTDQPYRIMIDDLQIHKTLDTSGIDRAVSVIADDLKMTNVHVFTNQGVTSGNYAMYLRGARVTARDIKITNVGSFQARGILAGFSSSYPTSDVTVADIEMTNMAALCDFEASITGNNLLSYDPGAQRNIGTGNNYINDISGTASYAVSRRAWVRTYTVSGGGTYQPKPALETVTRLNVTDNTAFTIGAPIITPKTGMTQEIVVVNSTSGSLGIITWNAIYALRSTFVAPPAGEAHSITFVYNGTTWRETARSQGAIVPLTKSDIGLGNVDNTSDANKPVSTAQQTALDLKLTKSKSFLSVLDGYCVGDDTTDDTAGWNAAITAAATFGAAVYAPIPPVRYKITGPINPTAGMTIFGAGRKCEIRQYTRTNKPVFDCLNVDGVTIYGFTLSLDGGPLTTTGSSFRGENGYTYASGVWSNGSRNTFRDMRIIDFAGGVMLSSWDGTTLSSTKRTGNRVQNLEISGANFGILFHPQDRLQIRGIECYDFYDTSGGVNPLHTIYATGNTSLRHSNVSISDCITKNLTFGAAYQTKYVDGLVMNNMIADNCQGIYNGIDINDANLSNFVSTNDTGDVGASFALQKVSVIPERISISNVTITKALDTVGDNRCMSLYGNNMKLSNFNFFPNSNGSYSTYACILRGNKISLDGIKVTGIGPGKNRAVLVGFGVTYPSSDITVTNIETDNVNAIVDFELGLTGTNVVSYDPALQRNVTTTNNYFNQVSGTTPFILHRRDHTNTYTVSGGGSYKPIPPLETITRFDVTDTTAFTVNSPTVTAKTGMTHEIAIVNSSGGTLGAITWNAAWSLRSTFVAPPAGETHRVTFTYDGTVWRETSRSFGALNSIAIPGSVTAQLVAVTGLTGAVTQGRFVGGTTSGAPTSGTFAVNDYVVSGDGNFYICTSAGTPGTWVAVGTPAALNSIAADALISGEVVPPRDDWGSNSLAPASGALVLTHFTADKTETITTLTAYCGSTAASGTAPTLIRYGVYSVASNGDLTLIASTPNDTTLLAVANTEYPKALSSSWSKVVGQRYAVGPLVVTTGTMPTFQGRQFTATAGVNSLVRLAPATVSRVLSQTDLPSSVANASIVGFQAKVGIRMS